MRRRRAGDHSWQVVAGCSVTGLLHIILCCSAGQGTACPPGLQRICPGLGLTNPGEARSRAAGAPPVLGLEAAGILLRVLPHYIESQDRCHTGRLMQTDVTP